MKLFERFDRTQGSTLEKNVFLMFGKNIDSDGKPNGDYVKIELPFTAQRNILSAETFEWEVALARPYAFIMWRKPLGSDKYVNLRSVGWKPV